MSEELTKREKFMLFQALRFVIIRYLMSVTYGRQDGYERYERHAEMSGIIVSFIILEKYTEHEHFWLMREVHDYLAEILTDKLDEVIDFPIAERVYDYEEYAKKFFDVIITNIGELEKRVLKQKEELRAISLQDGEICCVKANKRATK